MGASFIDVFEVDPACSSFASMTFLTPWQNKLSSLQMTQLHTQWWPALMTRPNYNETSTSLLSGRKDGIWPSTQRSALHCQWPAAGNPWNTSTNYVVTYWRLSAVPSAWVLPSTGTWTGASTSTTCAQKPTRPSTSSRETWRLAPGRLRRWPTSHMFAQLLSMHVLSGTRPALEYACSVRDPYT